MNLMLNAYDIIRTHPTPRRFQIGEILLSQFTCPAQEERFSKTSATIGGWQICWGLQIAIPLNSARSGSGSIPVLGCDCPASSPDGFGNGRVR
jgi:hypothetical protein